MSQPGWGGGAPLAARLPTTAAAFLIPVPHLVLLPKSLVLHPEPLVLHLEPLYLGGQFLHLATGVPAGAPRQLPQPPHLLFGLGQLPLQTQVVSHQLLLAAALQALGEMALIGLREILLLERPTSAALPVTVPGLTLPAGAWVGGPLGHIQVGLLGVSVVHQELGGVVGCHGLAFGEQFFSDPGGPLALPLVPLLLLSPAELQVGPPVLLALCICAAEVSMPLAL